MDPEIPDKNGFNSLRMDRFMTAPLLATCYGSATPSVLTAK